MSFKSMERISPVTEALSSMKVDMDLLRTLSSVDWSTFGKKNSHTYRKELMIRFDKVGLNADEKFMVSFLFSVSKSKARVLSMMDKFPDTVKAAAWFPKVKMFVDSELTQCVSQAGPAKRFPAVNIPSTNPGLGLLCWVWRSDYDNIVLDNFFGRTTASQLLLDDECQGLAEEGYKRYWDDEAKRTKNSDSKVRGLPNPGMNENFYKNMAKDQHRLLMPNMEQFEPLEPRNTKTGYDITEIVSYLVFCMQKMGKMNKDDYLLMDVKKWESAPSLSKDMEKYVKDFWSKFQ